MHTVAYQIRSNKSGLLNSYQYFHIRIRRGSRLELDTDPYG